LFFIVAGKKVRFRFNCRENFKDALKKGKGKGMEIEIEMEMEEGNAEGYVRQLVHSSGCKEMQ